MSEEDGIESKDETTITNNDNVTVRTGTEEKQEEFYDAVDEGNSGEDGDAAQAAATATTTTTTTEEETKNDDNGGGEGNDNSKSGRDDEEEDTALEDVLNSPTSSPAEMSSITTTTTTSVTPTKTETAKAAKDYFFTPMSSKVSDLSSPPTETAQGEEKPDDTPITEPIDTTAAVNVNTAIEKIEELLEEKVTPSEIETIQDEEKPDTPTKPHVTTAAISTTTTTTTSANMETPKEPPTENPLKEELAKKKTAVEVELEVEVVKKRTITTTTTTTTAKTETPKETTEPTEPTENPLKEESAKEKTAEVPVEVVKKKTTMELMEEARAKLAVARGSVMEKEGEIAAIKGALRKLDVAKAAASAAATAKKAVGSGSTSGGGGGGDEDDKFENILKIEVIKVCFSSFRSFHIFTNIYSLYLFTINVKYSSLSQRLLFYSLLLFPSLSLSFLLRKHHPIV